MSTTQQEQNKRGGRPSMAAEDRKSEVIKFRVREDLKRLVDQAAEQSGRTISEEAEQRLTNSFALEPFHRLIFGNQCAAEFFKSLVYTITEIQQYQNPPGVQLGSPDWMTSDLTREALRSAIHATVECLIPPAHAPADTPWTPSQQRQYAAALAHMKEVGEAIALGVMGHAPADAEEMNLSGDPEH